jgi:hypothetical protein
MSITSFLVSLLIVLFTILLLYEMHRQKPQIAGSDHKGCARFADRLHLD